MTKVSIIIPARNQPRFLAQAIESSLNQTGVEVEVLLVDDGSDNCAGEDLARFAAHPNFKRVVQAEELVALSPYTLLCCAAPEREREAAVGEEGNPQRNWLGTAWNRGIIESSGAYLCFLDANDYYEPEKACRQAELLDQNPDLAFVYCDILSVDEEGRPLPEQCSVGATNRASSGNIFQSLMLGGYFPHDTVMIRRTVLEQLGGFDAELDGAADYELWLRVSAAGYRACYLDERLACCRNQTLPNSAPDGLPHTISVSPSPPTKPPLSRAGCSKEGGVGGEGRAEPWSPVGHKEVSASLAAYRKITRMYTKAVAEALGSLRQGERDTFELGVWLQKHLQRLWEKHQDLQLRETALQQRYAGLQQSHVELERSHAELQQRHAELEQHRADLQQRFEASQNALRLATEGRLPPEWLRRFFENTIAWKWRRSLRKRLTTLRNCFEDNGSRPLPGKKQ